MLSILDELLRFFYFFVFIISYLYLHFIWNGTHKFLDKTEFAYTLDGIEKQATIYKSNKTDAKKVILFLSGCYNLGYHAYIAKTMHDLEYNHGDIMRDYELICFEKYDQSSIIIYDDVAHYIKNSLNEIDKLVLVGFSAGGCVASHIMARLKDCSFKKRIITYDTPWQVQDNVEHFQGNTLYRPDILFYSRVYETYSTHYNYEDIKQHLDSSNHGSGASGLVKIIQNVHGFTREEMYEITGFNLDQTPDTRVYNIISKWDPFVVREGVHDAFVERNRANIKFYNKVIEKSCIGHCSDMGFSTEYLKDIVNAIQDK